VDNFECKKNRPCGLFRSCLTCARIRQAKIADAAEAIERTGHQLHLTTVRPIENTANALRAVRAQILKAGFAKMGLWTVETGEKFAGLHLNILSTKPHIPPDLCRLTWSEAITTSGRAAAAYISKQSGIPDSTQYSGKLYSQFGNIRDLLVAPGMPVIIQAAAIEQAITAAPDRLTAQERQIIASLQEPKSSKTHAEYMAIAKSHLPNIWAMLEQHRAEKSNRPTRPAAYPASSIAS